MELAKGGELFNYIINKRRLNENEAAYFFYQIINGIEYMHKNNVVHRDLKPENLLLTEDKIIKIIDFGLSNEFFPGSVLKTPCGSPCYAAPEMVLGKKYSGIKIDIWSTGIILYAMTCGYLPFEDKKNEILFKKIIDCDCEFPNHLSSVVKDLIKKILVTNPRDRATIDDIKKHHFYNQGKMIFYKEQKYCLENTFQNKEIELLINQKIITELNNKLNENYDMIDIENMKKSLDNTNAFNKTDQSQKCANDDANMHDIVNYSNGICQNNNLAQNKLGKDNFYNFSNVEYEIENKQEKENINFEEFKIDPKIFNSSRKSSMNDFPGIRKNSQNKKTSNKASPDKIHINNYKTNDNNTNAVDPRFYVSYDIMHNTVLRDKNFVKSLIAKIPKEQLISNNNSNYHSNNNSNNTKNKLNNKFNLTGGGTRIIERESRRSKSITANEASLGQPKINININCIKKIENVSVNIVPFVAIPSIPYTSRTSKNKIDLVNFKSKEKVNANSSNNNTINSSINLYSYTNNINKIIKTSSANSFSKFNNTTIKKHNRTKSKNSISSIGNSYNAIANININMNNTNNKYKPQYMTSQSNYNSIHTINNFNSIENNNNNDLNLNNAIVENYSSNINNQCKDAISGNNFMTTRNDNLICKNTKCNNANPNHNSNNINKKESLKNKFHKPTASSGKLNYKSVDYTLDSKSMYTQFKDCSPHIFHTNITAHKNISSSLKKSFKYKSSNNKNNFYKTEKLQPKAYYDVRSDRKYGSGKVNRYGFINLISSKNVSNINISLNNKKKNSHSIRLNTPKRNNEFANLLLNNFYKKNSLHHPNFHNNNTINTSLNFKSSPNDNKISIEDNISNLNLNYPNSNAIMNNNACVNHGSNNNNIINNNNTSSIMNTININNHLASNTVISAIVNNNNLINNLNNISNNILDFNLINSNAKSKRKNNSTNYNYSNSLSTNYSNSKNPNMFLFCSESKQFKSPGKSSSDKLKVTDIKKNNSKYKDTIINNDKKPTKPLQENKIVLANTERFFSENSRSEHLDLKKSSSLITNNIPYSESNTNTIRKPEATKVNNHINNNNYSTLIESEQKNLNNFNKNLINKTIQPECLEKEYGTEGDNKLKRFRRIIKDSFGSSNYAYDLSCLQRYESPKNKFENTTSLNLKNSLRFSVKETNLQKTIGNISNRVISNNEKSNVTGIVSNSRPVSKNDLKIKNSSNSKTKYKSNNNSLYNKATHIQKEFDLFFKKVTESLKLKESSMENNINNNNNQNSNNNQYRNNNNDNQINPRHSYSSYKNELNNKDKPLNNYVTLDLFNLKKNISQSNNNNNINNSNQVNNNTSRKPETPQNSDNRHKNGETSLKGTLLNSKKLPSENYTTNVNKNIPKFSLKSGSISQKKFSLTNKYQPKK